MTGAGTQPASSRYLPSTCRERTLESRRSWRVGRAPLARYGVPGAKPGAGPGIGTQGTRERVGEPRQGRGYSRSKGTMTRCRWVLRLPAA